MGWLLDPGAIRNVLKSLKKYRKDIYITENGLADESDEKRPWYLTSILENVLKSIYIDKVKVKGYMHWTLTDNFEWEYGFKYKFGLVEINRNKLLKRIKRKSFDIYKMICKTKRI
jgi:beta-galactosidase